MMYTETVILVYQRMLNWTLKCVEVSWVAVRALVDELVNKERRVVEVKDFFADVGDLLNSLQGKKKPWRESTTVLWSEKVVIKLELRQVNAKEDARIAPFYHVSTVEKCEVDCDQMCTMAEISSNLQGREKWETGRSWLDMFHCQNIIH